MIHHYVLPLYNPAVLWQFAWLLGLARVWMHPPTLEPLP